MMPFNLDQSYTQRTLITSLINEQSKFLNIDKARRINSIIFDHTYNNQTPPTAGAFSVRLSGTTTDGQTQEKIGLVRTLSVMPGDKVAVEVYAKYVDLSNGSLNSTVRSLVTSIAAGTATAGTVVDGAHYGASAASTFPYGGDLADQKAQDPDGGPKAYLNYLVFDRDYNLISTKSGYKKVTTDAQEDGNSITSLNPDGSAHQQLTGAIDITEAGYIYIYLSNEEETPVEVYFDDFKVTQVKSPVIQAEDYYPFGLSFNSYQRENTVPNKLNLFQNQEHIDDLGLNWDAFTFRNHQPEIGRFFNVDPLAEKFYYNSPYAFSENKVTGHVELEGLEAWDIKNEWNKENVEKYRAYSEKRGNEAKENGEKHTCEDFALTVLIDFASENGLPVSIENGEGMHDANSESYNSVDEYKQDVFKTTAARDLQKESNTEPTSSPKSAQAGDLLLGRMDDNVAFHVQVVTSKKGDKTEIHQGSQGPGSADPSSFFYSGKSISKGKWDTAKDIYTNPPKTISEYSKNYNLEGRKWNFNAFNKRKK